MPYGLGVHVETVNLPLLEYLYHNLLFLFIEELLYSIATALVKLSILFFYWRIFNRSGIRWPIRIVGGFVCCWLLARVSRALGRLS